MRDIYYVVYYRDIDIINAYVSTDTVTNTNGSPPMYSNKQANFKQVGPSETDTNFDSTNLKKVSHYPISMLITVKHKNDYFTKREIEWVNVAMDLKNPIGWPYPTKLKLIVNASQLKNKKLQLKIFPELNIFMENWLDDQNEEMIIPPPRCTHKYIGPITWTYY